MSKKKRFLRMLLSLLATSAFAVSALAQPTIYGIVINSSGWSTSNPQYGVYSFMPTGSVILTTAEHVDRWLMSNSGGVWYDRHLYYMHSLQGQGDNVFNTVYRWNTDTWTRELNYTLQGSTEEQMTKMACDLTYDPVTKQVYGFFFTADGGYELGTIVFTDETPLKTGIRRTPIDMLTIAANSKGELYGIGVNGALYRFDKTTGQSTLVGNTGVTPSEYRQGMTFDLRTDKLYWAAVVDDGTKSALYEVNTLTGQAAKIGDFANNEEITALWIPFGMADDNAPSTAEGLSVEFTGGSLTGQVAFTIPVTTYGGAALTGDVSYEVIVDGEASTALTGTAAPGTRVSRTMTLAEGTHLFAVTLSNAAGRGEQVKTSAYVGNDTPVAPQDLTISVDNDNFTARLKWTKPQRGANNGYINPDELTYTITRYPGAEVLESGYEGTSYYDELPDEPGIHSYYYTVQAFFAGKGSALATTQTFNVGDAMPIPWREDFTNRASFSQFSTINVDNDWCEWKWGNQMAQCQNNDLYCDNDADDWLITPPLKLQADRLYQLEFEASSFWLWDRGREEYFEVGFGDNPLGQDYEIVIERHMMQQTQEGIPVKYSVQLRPTKDGSYYIGFHCTTPLRNASRLEIDNIVVDESSLLTSPSAVTNLRVEAAAKGALRADVKFNAPTMDLAGNPVSTLTQILVYREGATDELLATFNNPTPGEELTCQDTKCVNGVNTYRVVPMAADNAGQLSRVSGWVGIDYPKSPQNIRATLTAEGIRITWDAPGEVGVNGGYVDPDDITYVVADKNGNELPGAGENDYLEATEFTDKNVTLAGPQVSNQYYVLPYSELGADASGIGISNVVVTGDPYELPIHESFANGGASYLWVLSAGQSDYGFRLTRQVSYDGDNGALYFSGSSYLPSVSAEVGSGKLSMKGTDSPRWSFAYKPYVGHGVVATCQVQTADFAIHDVLTIDYRQLTGSNDWRKAVIDLTPYKDQEWVRVIVKVTIIGGAYQWTMDAIDIEDAGGEDLAASLYAPQTIRMGMPKDVKVTVRNLGSKATDDYSVRLLADGQLCGEQQGVSVSPLDSTVYSFAYSPAVTAGKAVGFQAIVDFASDSNTADNTTAAIRTTILESALPGVRSLTGTVGQNEVALAWLRPDTDGRQVTEDFEDYSSWLTEGFGQWQVVDQDNGRTYDMANCKYPHQTMQTAFMVFNNSETSGTRYSAMNARSGEQVAASFDAIPRQTTLGRTADWLISPELSGARQTVSFYARSVAESYLETMEVAYTTGDATECSAYQTLKTVDGVPNAWTHFEVELPAGARHFAIKNVSTDKMALIVDDVTYEPLPLVLTGYNVYVDGELKTTVGAEATTCSLAFTDDERACQVTAVYTAGESALSQLVTLGIDHVMTTVDLATADLTVYTVDGKLLAQGRGVWQQLQRGVYVVRLAGNDKAVKVRKN